MIEMLLQRRGVALLTVISFFVEAKAQDCVDPLWCSIASKELCVVIDLVRNSCKGLCDTCRKDPHCPNIPPTFQGDVTVTSRSPYKVGTVATFSCDVGYQRIGASKITCLSSGKWSKKPPNCKTTICKRVQSKWEVGRRCYKPCQKDRECRGVRKSCQCDDWCGKTCFNPKAECPRPLAPENGFIHANAWSFGRKVRYSCKEGHALIGPTWRTCRSDKRWSGHEPYCVPFSACGHTVKSTANPIRIVHGKDANNGDWPWQVLLIKSGGYSVEQVHNKKSVVGGGSVINDEWVLSAAHIFTHSYFQDNLKANNWSSSFLLVIGMTAFVQKGLEIPEHIQIFEPKSDAVYLHPKYNDKNYDYDVALVRIGARLKHGPYDKFVVDEKGPSGKLTFSEVVRPVCLPCMKGSVLSSVNVLNNFDKQKCNQTDKSIFRNFASTGSSATVTGFGLLQSGVSILPDILQEGQIQIIDPLKCAHDIPEIKLRHPDARFSERMFCASGGTKWKRIDSCHGDSGGPVVKKIDTESKKLKYWMQLGIVSWGVGCATRYHGYYTSVPSIMNWVWKTLNDDREDLSGLWDEWQAWTHCDVTCDGGQKTRTRRCLGPGECNGNTVERKQCNTQACPGLWNKWQAWTHCDVTCDGGQQTRTRRCLGPGECNGNMVERKQCNTQTCPGLWDEWQRWTHCDVTCDGGQMTRTRRCLGPGECNGNMVKRKRCNTHTCPGVWEDWGVWTPCSARCDGGQKSRTRFCLGPDVCRGDGSETELCNTQACIGVWSGWGDWTQCSDFCEGQKRRTRKCSGPGGCRGDHSETQSCNTRKCLSGHWGRWQLDTICSESCGGGIKTRQRFCHEGRPCNRTKETMRCNTYSCRWSQWGEFSECSSFCGRGVKTRRRICRRPGKCPGSSEIIEPCIGSLPCPAGVWREWGDWGKCSKSCEKGVKTRKRTCSKVGRCLGKSEESAECNIMRCSDPYKVRLANGKNSHSGRVEIFYRGSWGTICDSSWNFSTARVVCRILGFPDVKEFRRRAWVGEGVGNILMLLDCPGDASSLNKCRFFRWPTYFCGHNQDASVICKQWE